MNKHALYLLGLLGLLATAACDLPTASSSSLDQPSSSCGSVPTDRPLNLPANAVSDC